MPVVAITTCNSDERQQVLQCWLKIVGNGKRGNPKRRPKLLLLIKATMPDGCVSDSELSCIDHQIKKRHWVVKAG